MAAYSRQALDRPLETDAELWVAVARDSAIALGAFQRREGVVTPGESRRILRRGSGGPEVALGPGTIHVAFSLPPRGASGEMGAFPHVDPTRIVNRLVRPLLRALTKTGFTAHFFGRDWISVAQRPVGWVGFAHDATRRRVVFEAFVAVGTPFAPPGRPSHRGKAPVSLDVAGARSVDVERVVGALIDTYAEAYAADLVALAPLVIEAGEAVAATNGDPGDRRDPLWAATAEEAIGLVGAGPDARGVFRVGGDLLVSRDALARLETEAAAAPLAALGRLVDETLGAPGVALDGVRSLASIQDVIVRARESGG
jgi:hypothetical protein